MRPTRRQVCLGLAAGVAGCTMSRGEPTQEPAAEKAAAAVPTAFIGHGAPTTAIDPVKGAPLATWGSALQKRGDLRAMLVVSAHWETAVPTLGSVERRPLMYDFSGFPRPLYEIQYPAPGAPVVRDRVRALLDASPPNDAPTRPLDHGVWTPLVHMFPDAARPVLQLSLPRTLDARGLFELGRSLAPLRREGVWIVGSGNITHNLGRVAFREKGDGPTEAWAADFDAWIADHIDRWDVDPLLDARAKAPAYTTNHPTDEHFRPLYVALGAAAADGRPNVRYTVKGFEFGTLSRRSMELG